MPFCNNLTKIKSNRRVLLLISVIVAFVQVGAQIPNGGFEEWVAEQGFEKPLNWITNQSTSPSRFERDTNRVEGLYSLKILSHSGSGWDECTHTASVGFRLTAPLGKNKALSLFVRSMPHPDNISGKIFLQIRGDLYIDDDVVYQYSWSADEPIPEFSEIIIPLYRSATDSMTIEILGGGQSAATDGCIEMAISWIDAISIKEITEVSESDCAQKVTFSPGMPGVFFTNMFRQHDTLIVSGILSRVDNFSVQHPVLLRFDTTGQLFDYFVFEDSLWSDYHHIFSQRKKGLCPAVDAGYVMMNRQTGKEVVWKVSKTGEILWMKEFKDDHISSRSFHQIEKTDDGYLVSGNKRDVNTTREIFLMKLDVYGDIAWEKSYSTGSEYDTSIDDMHIADDNEVIISANISSGDEPEDRLFKNVVFVIDRNGNVKWQGESEISMNQMSGGVLPDNKGNWAYMTNFYVNESNGGFKVKPKFFKRNTELQLLQERDLDDLDGVFNVIEDMVEISDGGYLGIGGNYEPGVPDNHTYAWVIRVNEEGEVLWERKDLAFSDSDVPTFQNLLTAVELPGGNIIAVGYSYNNETEEAHGLLLKLDPCGCLDTICEIATSSKRIPEINEWPIIVYPNPASDYLTFDLSTDLHRAFAELYDISGRAIARREIHAGKNTIHLGEFPDGLLVWRVVTERGELVRQGKVIVRSSRN